MAEGIRLLELSRNARRLFEKQKAREKRGLLDFVVSNYSSEDGQLKAEFRQPFDLLADTATAAALAEATGGLDKTKERFGWEAGIRTLIPRSRAACPAVERPPSKNRNL